MHVTQNQTFACILQSECSEKNRKGSIKDNAHVRVFFSNITIWLYQNEISPGTFSETCLHYFTTQH